MTRRQWLFLAAAQAAASQALRAEEHESIADTIRAFEEQGNHRTGTEVDRLSADWLMGQVALRGLPPAREAFPLDRVDPVTASLTIGGRRVEGIPLFDGGFTDAKGITGRIGPLKSGAPIGITEIGQNTAGGGAFGEARRNNSHRAIVVVTKGARPGLCPSNANSFLRPFGPPVLQISSEDADILKEGADGTLVAEVKRTAVSAFNVTTMVHGSNPQLSPLVVMTPRSGWWTCASERGGGIICWLEVMRAVRDAKPARDVLLAATSGHELGYLGLEAYVAARPGIVKRARSWIHFGANIGAAQDEGNTVQASDDEMESIEVAAILKANFKIDRRVPRGTAPGGEAGLVHRDGGHYMSLLGRNALFHNTTDRGPEAVDTDAIARYAAAFGVIAKSLAGT